MGHVSIEAVGEDVLLVIEQTQMLLPRDLATRIALGLLQVAGSKGSALDEVEALAQGERS